MTHDQELWQGEDQRTDGTVAERIRLRFGTLTATERRAARTLLADYPVAGLHTVQGLADAASVSTASIVRFVKSLGFDGFREFQDSLRHEVQARQDSPLTQLQQERRVLEVRKSGAAESRATAQALRDSLDTFLSETRETFAALPLTEVTAVVALLADPKRRIRTLGGEFSDVVARHLVAQLSLFRGGVSMAPARRLETANVLLDTAARSDVWVVFDFRRYSADVARDAHLAKQHGAKLVLITDRWLSPIASVADQVLTCHVEARGPSDTLVPALTLVEALCEQVVARLGATGYQRLEQVEALRSQS